MREKSDLILIQDKWESEFLESERKLFLDRNWKLISRFGFPLILLFFVGDIFAAPNLRAEFFLVRLFATVAFVGILNLYRFEIVRQRYLVWPTIMVATISAGFITWMTAYVSEYFHGLAVVIVAALAFIPWARRRHIGIVCAVTYGPYFLGVVLGLIKESNAILPFNIILAFGLSVSGIVVWIENRRLRRAEFFAGRESLRQHEARLREYERSEYLIQLARSVAHDIRSPIGAIRTVLGVNQSLANDERSLIESSLKRFTFIADDLLRKSKEKGNETIGSGRIMGADLVELCKNLIEEKRLLIGVEKKIDFDLHADVVDESLVIPIEQGILGRVLSNILNNSIEAILQEGSVSIVLIRNDDGSLTIEIRDNGKGIPSTILPRLSRAEISFGKTDGNGLGLFSARQILIQHGGDITIDSKEGIGTSVQVKMPLSKV